MTVLTKTLRAGLLSGFFVVLPVLLTPAWLWAAADSFPLDKGDTCLGCHEDLTAKKHKHGAIEDSDSCTVCHELANPAIHAPSLPEKNVGELCAGCHDPFSGKGSSHGPVEAGECTACHDPHSSEQAKLLRKAQPELCFICHDKAVKDDQEKGLPSTKDLFNDEQATLHPPFADGDCSVCHVPHNSEQQRLLTDSYSKNFYVKYSEKAYALCFTCHEAEAFRQPRTQSGTAFRNGNLNLHFRHVNKEKGRTCRACHSAHGTRQPHQIVGGFMFGERPLALSYTPTDNGGECMTACHGKAGYDRVLPVFNTLRATPRPGEDASLEELSAQPEPLDSAKE